MTRDRLVVVGNGMAGGRFVQDLVARGGADRFAITIFGDEPHGNYNRILLSGVLAGDHGREDIFIQDGAWYGAHGVTLHAGTRVEAVDTGAKRVHAAGGLVEEYDRLVIATGSRPFIPRMEGLPDEGAAFKDGLFVFRTLDDCERMRRFALNARRAVVIGGGLLGLEAARGLAGQVRDVQIVHLMPHVMEAQLDPAAAAILARQLEQMGLRIHVERQTAAVLGNGHVTGLRFTDGTTLDCDMVVLSAGIRPNVGMASAAGLPVRRGIVVGDDLACEGADGVYAVGECAEHRGEVYGLVAPLWEQTRVLADRLSGRRPEARYSGSRTSTKLKVAGVDLAVMGSREPSGPGDEVITYSEPGRGVYKKLIVRDDLLMGAIVMGDGSIVPSLLQAFADRSPLAANRAALLFPRSFDVPSPSVESLPDTAQICDCNAVSKGRIVEAVLQGARGMPAVCAATRAGTGCGTCRPEVEAIVDSVCRSLGAPRGTTGAELTLECA